MDKNAVNIFLAFLRKHLIYNLYWWLPLLILSFFWSLFISVLFLSYFISYTFWQWSKYNKPKKLKIHQVSIGIEWGYRISTGLFILLTGYSVFMGIMSNFVIHKKVEIYFVIGYSLAITLALLTLIYMIKSGRKWRMICLIYLLFDIPGAMPFNFLFFFENQKTQNRLDIDKNLVDEIKMKCDSVVKPLFEISKKNILSLTEIQKGNISSADKQQTANKKNTEDQAAAQTKIVQGITNIRKKDAAILKIASAVKIPNANYKTDTTLINELAKNRTDSNSYQALIYKLDAIEPFLKDLKNNKDREQQLIITENIKSRLKDICASSSSIVLQEKAKELLPNEPTQLESLEALYNYVIEKVLSLSSENPADKKTQKIVIMSLIPSVIIDLLPLLFSIIYANWSKNEEEAY